jgi:hypothetical protein
MKILHIRVAREESPLGEFLLLWIQHTLYSDHHLVFKVCLGLGCSFDTARIYFVTLIVSPASEANVATRGVLGIKALVITVVSLSQGEGDARPVVDRQVDEADLDRGCVHVDCATALSKGPVRHAEDVGKRRAYGGFP